MATGMTIREADKAKCDSAQLRSGNVKLSQSVIHIDVDFTMTYVLAFQDTKTAHTAPRPKARSLYTCTLKRKNSKIQRGIHQLKECKGTSECLNMWRQRVLRAPDCFGMHGPHTKVCSPEESICHLHIRYKAEILWPPPALYRAVRANEISRVGWVYLEN